MEEGRQRHEGSNHVASVDVEQIDGFGEVAAARCIGQVGRLHWQREVIRQQQNCDERHSVQNAGTNVEATKARDLLFHVNETTASDLVCLDGRFPQLFPTRSPWVSRRGCGCWRCWLRVTDESLGKVGGICRTERVGTCDESSGGLGRAT